MSTPDAVIHVPSALVHGKQVYCVRVNGSCMSPEVNDGDYVLVELGRLPQDGEVAVVEYDGHSLIKRWWNEGDRVELAANRRVDCQTVPKAEVVVVGTVFAGVYEVLRQTRRQRRSFEARSRA